MNRREFVLSAAAAGFASKGTLLAQAATAAHTTRTAAHPSFPAIDAEPLGGVPEGAFLLHDHWQMREEVLAGNHGAAFSTPGYAASAAWYATTVPTTRLGTLIRHGVYPDPYIGLNNLLIPDACSAHNDRYNLARHSHLPDRANPWSAPYWFRTEFQLPAGFGGSIVWLHLDGINYRADVWLNGHLLADHSSVAGMFQRFHFDVSRLLRRDSRNALAVRIHSLDTPGDPMQEQLEGLAGGFGPNGGDGEILRNVTQYCSVGWDWVPAARDRNTGLWQHVWLESTGPVAVRDPAAFVTLRADEDSASLAIRGFWEQTGTAPIEAELLVRITLDGADADSPPVTFRLPVVVPPGKEQEFHFSAADHPELQIPHPRLWWPSEYGEQALYTLTVECRVAGSLSSRAQSKIGMRSVGTVVLPSGGRAFTVHGRVIRMTGGAWVPDFLMSWNAQRYRDEVRLMAEGNHTIVRVNGCGIMPPEVFFDECDRRGLLVWLDFSRTSISAEARLDHLPSNDPLPCDASLLLANMKDCIRRMRSHPSLLLYCGCNEGAPQADFGQPMQNAVLPAMDDSRPWLPSSNSDPIWEQDAIHTWSSGPYSLQRLPDYFHLYASDPRFTSKNEIGLASPLGMTSLKRAIPALFNGSLSEQEKDIQLSYHDQTGDFTRATFAILARDLGASTSLAESLCMAELYTGAAYRAIYEAANKARPRNAGTHLWKVNAAWPSMMWQVFDWTLRTNAGYYGMKSACQPLHIQMSVDDGSIQVVSTKAVPQNGMRASVKLVSLDGTTVASDGWLVNCPADTTLQVGHVPRLMAADALHFVSLTLADSSGAEIDHSVVWMQRDCKWHDLLRLAPAELSLALRKSSQSLGETTYELVVANPGSIPAVQARLSLLAAERGDEVLPSHWDDNSFCLLPGDEKRVSVTVRSALLAGAEPHVVMEGWNILPYELRLHDNQRIPLSLETPRTTTDLQQRTVQIRVENAHSQPKGDRIMIWPIAVTRNGTLLRTVRIGVQRGVPAFATLTVDDLTPLDHFGTQVLLT